MEIKMGIMDEGDLYDIANMAISLLFQNKKNGTIVNSVSFKYKDKEYKLNKDESISMFQKKYPEFGLNDSNGVSFIDEEDKIEDMKILTKDEFLKSYDYLTVDDYFTTIKDLAIKDEKWIMFLMKPRANVKVNIWDNTMSEKLKNSLTLPHELKYLFINEAKDYEEFEKLIEKYVNEQPSLAHLSHRGNMKQFYDRAICDFEN